MPIDKRVEVCLLTTFLVILLLIAAIIYLVLWLLYTIGVLMYKYPENTGLILLGIVIVRLVRRTLRYLRQRAIVRKPDPPNTICYSSLRKEIEAVHRRALQYSSRKKIRRKRCYKISKETRKLLLFGEKFVKWRKITLEKCIRFSIEGKAIVQFLVDKMHEKEERDKKEVVLKQRFETSEEGDDEIERHMALFDVQKAKFYVDHRDFINKPIIPAVSWYKRPATYYPFRCNIVILKAAIKKVDQAFNTYKIQLELISKVDGAFTHLVCVLADMLETDEAKMAMEGPYDTDIESRITVHKPTVNRKKPFWFNTVYIYHVISTTHAQIVFFGESIMHLVDLNKLQIAKANYRNITIDKDYYMEMQNLLNHLSHHALPEIRTNMDTIYSARLDRGLQAIKQRTIREREIKDGGHIGQRFIDETMRKVSKEKRRRDKEREEYWNRLVDLQEEPTHPHPRRRRLRIPDRKQIEDSLYLATGCIGIGVATFYAIKYLIQR